MNNKAGRIFFYLSTLLCTFFTAAARAAWTLNMPRGVTPLSHEVYQLHMLVFWICVGIAVIVFGMMLYILVNHRKSKGAVAASFHENTFIEVTWAIIPLIILVLIAVPATKALFRMNDTSDSALTIKVTGYQWRWRYEYLDQGLDFFSSLSTPANQLNNLADKKTWYLLEVDHPLIVPIRKKIRFLFTSNDVIHSWWVPTLGLKRDTIPGFINESWAIIEKTGEYRGQCAELCGVNHGFMPIVVKAVEPSEFSQWVKNAKRDFSPALNSPTQHI